MSFWAIDLGTTNTAVARWDAAAYRPRLIELPNVCRNPGGEDHLEAPRLVPSATAIVESPSALARLASRSRLVGRLFPAERAEIGRVAIESHRGAARPSFVPSFKPALLHEAMRPIARVGRRSYSAREVAELFVGALLREVKTVTGERVRELALTTPVESYEFYRAELNQIMRRAGVRRVRFIDEPVAAAIGYGLNIAKDRLVLVVDMGGGTLHLALVGLSAKTVVAGGGRVLAKEGRELGGRTVDQWLLEELCRRLEQPLPDPRAGDEAAFWHRVMLEEACRVKEAVFFRPSETFFLLRPDELAGFEDRVRGADASLDVKREDLEGVLEAGGLYATIDECLEGILRQVAPLGIAEADVDDVLMVGGSTLLPGVYPRFERRFGRDRVRAWQPFEAVAYGACCFASDSLTQSDFIVHDYAFVTYDPNTHQKEHTIVVPRGTRFPTPPDLWKRQLVPTCSLGEPETLFKLVISEIGVAHGERRFVWDERGGLHKVGGQTEPDGRIIVPLNETNPTLGYLKPPHAPNDRRPRLEISFGVNADRWLFATVYDLRTRRHLMREEPVVRLL